MSEPGTALERIASAYEGNPIIRALVQIPLALVPYGVGSAVDAALTSAIEDMREDRLRAFFDELDKGAVPLSEETIRDHDFLHAYFATLKAATNTRREEKVRLFARLLASGAAEGQLGSDAFEEFLDILESISVRELRLLLLVKELEDAHPHQELKAESTDQDETMENDLQRATRFWPTLEARAAAELGMPPGILRAMLARLNRTGLYETFIGGFLDYTGGKGATTPLFGAFVAWLQKRASPSAPA